MGSVIYIKHMNSTLYSVNNFGMQLTKEIIKSKNSVLNRTEKSVFCSAFQVALMCCQVWKLIEIQLFYWKTEGKSQIICDFHYKFSGILTVFLLIYFHIV